jgi:hypothetical protein
MKKRTEEQTRALSEWTEKLSDDFCRLYDLSGDVEGLDGITVDSCWQNGRETAAEIGITEGEGFTDAEISQASDYFAVLTARLFEII